MSERPSEPNQCPICQRIDVRLRQSPITAKLSQNEIDQLIKEAQNAVLNKVNTSKGAKMSDQVIIEKANMDELMEASTYTLLILEKMAGEVARANNTIAILGGELADQKAEIAQLRKGAFGLQEEAAPQEEENNEVVMPNQAPAAPAAPMAPAGPLGPGAPGAPAPMAPGPAPMAPAPAPAAPMAPSPCAPQPGAVPEAPGVPPMGPDMTKGVPTNFEYPSYSPARVMGKQEYEKHVENMEKSNSMPKLGAKSPADVIAELMSENLF